MAQRSDRCLEPAFGGEQVPNGFDLERMLPSLSRQPARARSRFALVLSVCLAAQWLMVVWSSATGADRDGAAGVGAGPVSLSDRPAAGDASGTEALIPLLAPLAQGLGRACGCDTFRVEWSVQPALSRRVARLESPVAEIIVPASPQDSCPDRVAVRLTGRENGRQVELLLRGEPLCLSTVPVARHGVPPGEVLLEGDLRFEHGWFPPSALRAGERSAVGACLTASLPAGRWIRRDALRDPPWVRRNEPLRVIYASGSLRLEGRGTARRDAWAGDRVAVRLQGADRDCQALVSGVGEVRIETSPPVARRSGG